ncbi:hypothetical protein [Pandoraea fibrosis]|uniref:Uncharacterized protein n=1 Tax=Pandoraea fibrosis TaxID=1891094 RepID=A0A5E4SQT0_9BURK|nr:hypothetical protein [Pandoraea fibrosis]VVD76219.1 hypothetical protein PFI31113_00863 [Pandoraea fibrosis]
MIRAAYDASILKTINDMYRTNFINTEAPYMLNHPTQEASILVGEFTNIGAATYTTGPSKIFNAVNALILVNQVSYALACITNLIDAKLGTSEASRMLLTNANITCTRMIGDASCKTFIFESQSSEIDVSGRKQFNGRMDISEGAFVVDVQGIITSTNKHALPVASGTG